jgi:hypothetical protein
MYRKTKNPDNFRYQDLGSALAGIQTPNLLIRSQMLYSVELQVRFKIQVITRAVYC